MTCAVCPELGKILVATRGSSNWPLSAFRWPGRPSGATVRASDGVRGHRKRPRRWSVGGRSFPDGGRPFPRRRFRRDELFEKRVACDAHRHNGGVPATVFWTASAVSVSSVMVVVLGPRRPRWGRLTSGGQVTAEAATNGAGAETTATAAEQSAAASTKVAAGRSNGGGRRRLHRGPPHHYSVNN